MSALQRWYEGRNQREQRVLLAGACAVVAIILVAGLTGLDRAVATAERRVVQKRQDIAWLQAVAPQVSQLPAQRARRGNESLVALTARLAQETNIASTMVGSQPSGNGALRVRFEKASFDALALWLAQLAEQAPINVESATVESAGAAGLVNATIVLRSR